MTRLHWILSHLYALLVGAALAIGIGLPLMIGALTALVDEADARASRALLHQIADHRPTPQECVIADRRAACVVVAGRRREIAQFAVEKR